MPYRAVTIANQLIQKSLDAGKPLTPLQVLKLVYIAHGWSLGLLERPLITEDVEAWRYGPVVPPLYNKLKKFGGGSVTETLPRSFGEPIETLDGQTSELLDGVYQNYGNLTGVQLSHLTHMAGTPWAQVYQPDRYHIEIPESLIVAHYKQLARERAA
jgi:uncharacterized phage-associated protein